MVSRYICSVIEEIRTLHKTRNYGSLPGLIEEVQTLANRMEAALEEKNDYNRLHEDVKEKRKLRRKLDKKLTKLQKKVDSLEKKAEKLEKSKCRIGFHTSALSDSDCKGRVEKKEKK